MNRYKKILFIIVFIYLFVSATFAAASNLMSVQVKKGHLRYMPSFLGKIIVALDYGDRVAVLEKKGSWIKVQSFGKNTAGWLHSSALTSTKIVLQSGAEDVELSATSDELALAGKGFNKKVEGKFKSKNPHLDYTLINKMEQVIVSQAQIEQFLKDGELSPKGVKQ
ncbi:MAG: SH3 domain-containing protein [Desulfobacteraceae bacterium]|jgi:hypothetical protein|nr:SH3 domain-containing protein [Desulfobacteraceae bacterium]MBT4365572.1 SH3 domain-containing protein [Desulfobacteraceae bacterium]